MGEVDDEEVKSKELPRFFLKKMIQPSKGKINEGNSNDEQAIHSLRGMNKYLYNRLVSLGYYDK